LAVALYRDVFLTPEKKKKKEKKKKIKNIVAEF